MKIRDRVFRAVLDTGATLSIVARRLLKTFRKTKTVAIRVGDGRTIHSLGGVDVTICLGDETVTQHCRVLDTDAFDIVIGTDFLRRNPQVKMLSLQRPYSLHCDFGSGLFSVPLELSGRKESGLRYAAKTNYRTEKLPTGPSCSRKWTGGPSGKPGRDLGGIVCEPTTAHHAVVLLETNEQCFPILLESNGPSVC